MGQFPRDSGERKLSLVRLRLPALGLRRRHSFRCRWQRVVAIGRVQAGAGPTAARLSRPWQLS